MFIEVDEDFIEHPKSVRLCRALQNPLGWAYVIKLWRWCTKFQHDGDLSSFTPEEIEAALGWTLDDGVLYGALVRCGFIDEGGSAETATRIVHDWDRHQGKWIRKLKADRAAAKLRRAGRRREDQRDDEPVSLHELAELEKQADLPLEVVPDRESPASHRRRTDVATTSVTAKPSLAKQSRADPDADSSEPLRDSKPAVPDDPHVMTFETVGTGAQAWFLRVSLVEQLRAAFPGVDVMGEARQAGVWLATNPSRRKTARGMPEFLRAWMARSQNRGSPSGAAVSRFGTAAKEAATDAALRAAFDRGGARDGRRTSPLLALAESPGDDVPNGADR